MRKILLMMLTLCSSAFAVESSVFNPSGIDNIEKTNQLGIGLQAGTSTGVNVEYWVAQDKTWNIFGAQEHSNLAVGLGQNIMFREVFTGDLRSLALYTGAGLLGIFGDNVDYLSRTNANPNFVLAAQIPLGVEWLPRSQRFSVFGQVAPSLEVTPVLMGFINADLGARFYF